VPRLDVLTEFREIAGFPGYRVGQEGTVQSCWRRGPKPRMTSDWHTLRGGVARRHRYVWLFLPGRGRTFAYVHHLVLEAFVGPRPPGTEACHNNGDPSDNRLENLRWDTRRANRHDMRRHGTHLAGERVGSSKLTWAQVEAIRQLRALGAKQRLLAAACRVGIATISQVVNRKSWHYRPQEAPCHP
jgi:hypothetical protein